MKIPNGNHSEFFPWKQTLPKEKKQLIHSIIDILFEIGLFIIHCNYKSLCYIP